VSKLLTFLRDLGDGKKDIRKYIVDNDDPRINKVEIPLSDIYDILTASLGKLFQFRGFKISGVKIDPY